MRWLLVAALLLGGAGCAPTSLSPMVMRMMPGDALRGPQGSIGIRTGPRLATPLAGASTPGPSVPFPGDNNIFSVPQWGFAYDLGTTVPIGEGNFAAHIGVQGEFYAPLPLPAYGVYAGFSHYIPMGKASIAPALSGRFATDFGFPSSAVSGTQAGGELSVAIAFRPEESVAIGIVPFASYDHIWSRARETNGLYTGAAVVVRLRVGGQSYELSGGFGRVFMPGNAWNVPILGIRAGR